MTDLGNGFRHNGTHMERLVNGVWVSGVEVTLAEAQATVAEMVARSAAVASRSADTDTARDSLTDAVQLAALSPYPTPEEQAIIDAQVSASLALFRALTDPPADVTALAAAVLTLEVAR